MSLATSNAFAALAKAKKKGSSKDGERKGSSKKHGKDKKAVSSAELEKAIFSQPSLNISSWADEEDDDYAVPVLPSNWEVRRVLGARLGGPLRPRQRALAPPLQPLSPLAPAIWRPAARRAQGGGAGNGAPAGEGGDEEHDHDEHEHEHETEEVGTGG